MTVCRFAFGPRFRKYDDPSGDLSHGEISPPAAERSITASRGYAVAGGGWVSHLCSALPPGRAIGSTTDPSVGATGANAPERGESHTPGNRLVRTPRAVARDVL